MTRDEILNRIAIEKHGRLFNQIEAMSSRGMILQDALDEVLELLNRNSKVKPSQAKVQIPTNRAELSKGDEIKLKSGLEYEIIKVFEGGIYDIKALQAQFEWMPHFYPIYYSIQIIDYEIINPQ